jgi:tetratricopeptide (TPR) repeat protein
MRRSIFALALLFAPVAHAQEAASELQQAEEAYQNIDFEGVQSHALAALRAGGHPRAELVRIYQLLGVSASALEQEEQARDYFIRMLALDPDADLDESVPPRLRDPYLEARGVWAARPTRLELAVHLDRAQSALRVELVDPSHMARYIAIHARLEGAAQYEDHEVPATAIATAPVQGAAQADRVEYYVEVLDEHRNVVVDAGSAFQPRVVGRQPVGPGGSGQSGPSVFEEPAFWIITLIVLGAAAGITGGIIADQRSRIGVQTGVTIGID